MSESLIYLTLTIIMSNLRRWDWLCETHHSFLKKKKQKNKPPRKGEFSIGRTCWIGKISNENLLFIQRGVTKQVMTATHSPSAPPMCLNTELTKPAVDFGRQLILHVLCFAADKPSAKRFPVGLQTPGISSTTHYILPTSKSSDSNDFLALSIIDLDRWPRDLRLYIKNLFDPFSLWLDLFSNYLLI